MHSASGRTLLLSQSETGVELLGRTLFTGSREKLWHAIDALIATAEPQLIVTMNVDQVLNLRRDATFEAAYMASAIRTIDGEPIRRLANKIGTEAAERQTGADMLVDSPFFASAKGRTIAVVGGSDEALTTAVQNLRKSSGYERIYGVPFPRITSVGDQRTEEVIRQIQSVTADVVFICLGGPKQEQWFYHWRDRLPPAVYIGAGAAVDFVAGQKKRAPQWVQRAGLEWAYRVAQEPSRLAARYFVEGPKILPLFLTSLYSRGVHQ